MKSLVKKEFGKRLKAARKSAGLTQSRLGELVGVENITVSRWESGVFLPSEAQIPKLSTALGRDPGYFAGSQDTQSPRSVETLAAEVDRQAAEIARLKREQGQSPAAVLTGFKRELFDLIAGLDEPKAQGLLRLIRRTLELTQGIENLQEPQVLSKKPRR